MEMVVKKLSPEEWKPLARDAHSCVFNEDRIPERDHISFALLVEKADGTLLGYSTCIEAYDGALYIQYGGTFPGARSTSLSFKVYMTGLDWCKKRYKRLMFYVSNKNRVMLKFAMKAGFLITGVKILDQYILLDHEWQAAT